MSNGGVLTWFVICVAGAMISLAGCSDDDAGSGGSLDNSEVAQSARAACENAVECARANLPDGIDVDEDVICAVYDQFLEGSSAVSGSCIDAAEDYFDCIATASCGNFESECGAEEDDAEAECDDEQGTDDASDDDSSENTSLSEAAEAACDKAVECQGEDAPISREIVCAAFNGYVTAAGFLGGGCVSATETYLNCYAASSCDTEGTTCESENEALVSSCSSF
jgi:hypothetical protein